MDLKFWNGGVRLSFYFFYDYVFPILLNILQFDYDINNYRLYF